MPAGRGPAHVPERSQQTPVLQQGARSRSASKSRWEFTRGIPGCCSGPTDGIEPLRWIDSPVVRLSFSPPLKMP